MCVFVHQHAARVRERTSVALAAPCVTKVSNLQEKKIVFTLIDTDVTTQDHHTHRHVELSVRYTLLLSSEREMTLQTHTNEEMNTSTSVTLIKPLPLPCIFADPLISHARSLATSIHDVYHDIRTCT